MPYTREQCRLFGAKSRRGDPVPDDWQTHCRKSKGSKAKDAKKKRGR